jgi:hypothetical protein
MYTVSRLAVESRQSRHWSGCSPGRHLRCVIRRRDDQGRTWPVGSPDQGSPSECRQTSATLVRSQVTKVRARCVNGIEASLKREMVKAYEPLPYSTEWFKCDDIDYGRGRKYAQTDSVLSPFCSRTRDNRVAGLALLDSLSCNCSRIQYYIIRYYGGDLLYYPARHYYIP